MDSRYSVIQLYVISHSVMSEVEFSEEKAYNASIQRAVEAAPKKGLSNLPIKLGLAKDETGATIVLALAGVIAAILAVIIFLVAL